jgi:hypothetical protein
MTSRATGYVSRHPNRWDFIAVNSGLEALEAP